MATSFSRFVGLDELDFAGGLRSADYSSRALGVRLNLGRSGAPAAIRTRDLIAPEAWLQNPNDQAPCSNLWFPSEDQWPGKSPQRNSPRLLVKPAPRGGPPMKKLLAICTVVVVVATTQVARGAEVDKKEVIASSNAPKASGPYSQAIRYGNLVFLS